MIIALAGRRIDAQDASPSRFPQSNRKKVKEELKTLFKKRNAKALVSSAACGADLLALEVANELNLHYCIVLPSDPEEFREKSVTDRGGNWGEIFDKIYQKAKSLGNVIELGSTAENDQVYIEANNKIIDQAASIATKLSDETVSDFSESSIENHVLVVIVWEGKPRGEEDITANFAELGRARGFEVTEVLTK